MITKEGVFTIDAITITCAHCHTVQASPTGALNWTLPEIEPHRKGKACEECKKVIRFPKYIMLLDDIG